MTLGCVLWAAQGPVCKKPQGWQGLSRAWAGLEWQTQGRNLLGCPEGQSHCCHSSWGAQQGGTIAALQQECRMHWREKQEREKEKRLCCVSNLAVPASLLAFCFHPSVASSCSQPRKGSKVPWNKPASNSCATEIIKPACGFGSPESHHNSIKAVPCPLF